MAEWTKLTEKKFHDRKWELKQDGTVLATIFKQPAAFSTPERYSLYVSSPKLYEKFFESGRTHKYETFEEATEAFDKMAREEVIPWAKAVLAHFAD